MNSALPKKGQGFLRKEELGEDKNQRFKKHDQG